MQQGKLVAFQADRVLVICEVEAVSDCLTMVARDPYHFVFVPGYPGLWIRHSALVLTHFCSGHDHRVEPLGLLDAEAVLPCIARPRPRARQNPHRWLSRISLEGAELARNVLGGLAE